MSLIIATGSNIGNRIENLNMAKQQLSHYFSLVAASRIYRSNAVDYTQQPYFYNQVLEFKTETTNCETLLKTVLSIENEMGRVRTTPKGPRIIDIDIIFVGEQRFKSSEIEIPHPRLFERSFVLKPLKELPYYQTLSKSFDFPENFSEDAMPITS